MSCACMDEFDVRQLPTQRLVVFVASTTGEGEPPEGMRAFWRFLLRKDLPPSSLDRMKHATFGLGDSSYPKFNYAAKRLHRRLAQLGSTPLLPLGLGDDQDALGVDQALSPWLESLWEQIRLILPPSPHPPLSDSDPLPPRYLLRQTTQPDGPSFDPLRFSHLGENGSSVNSRLVRRRLLSEGDRLN